MPFSRFSAVGFFAQAGGESGAVDLIFATLLVLAGVALLIGVVAVVRKRFAAANAAEAGESFSLGGLRDLVRQGKMTQEEFEQAKAKIVEAHHRAVAREAADRAAKAARRVPPTL